MHIDLIKLMLQCLASEYNLLDCATILISLKERSNKITNQLSEECAEEYIHVKRAIKAMEKPQREELYTQIEGLANYCTMLAAEQDVAYDYKTIKAKIASLTSITSECSYGGTVLLLLCLSPYDDDLQQFIANIKKQKTTAADRKNLDQVITLLKYIRRAYKKDPNIGELIVEAVKNSFDLWVIKTQYL